MAPNRLDAVVRCIHRMAAGQAEHLSDRALLDRYVHHQSDDAFAVLVHRHAGLVLGACQRIVQDRHLAEDCFQAVFLVLATKAPTLERHDMIGPWLHAVACNVARKAMCVAKARQMREQRAARSLQQGPSESPEWRDLAPVLDEAVARLPGKSRTLFVLCYLQDKSIREIAKMQNLPVGTVASRLARARAQLRRKLVKQGVTLSTASLALALSDSNVSALPGQSLIDETNQVMKLMAAGSGATGALSQTTVSLTRGTVHMTILANLKALVSIVAVLAIGVCLIGYCSMVTVAGDDKLNDPNQLPHDDSKQNQQVSKKPGEQAGKLKSVPFLSLQRTPTDVYRLAPGDTIGLVIDGILGDSKLSVPVRQGENSDTPPAMGYPIVVREDGTIPLPQIGPLNVTGMSLAELELALRRQYTEKPRAVVLPVAFNAIITLMRKRTARIVVIRLDLGDDNVAKSGNGSSTVGSNRGNAQILDLPNGYNDLLTALVKTGGIPGVNSANEVVIERTRQTLKPASETSGDDAVKSNKTATSTKYVKQTLHIPLKLPANSPVPFTEDDITFQDGDIVIVPAREEAAADPAK